MFKSPIVTYQIDLLEVRPRWPCLIPHQNVFLLQMLKRYSNIYSYHLIHDNDVYFLGNTLSSMQIYTHSRATRKKASGSIKYLYDLIHVTMTCLNSLNFTQNQ